MLLLVNTSISIKFFFFRQIKTTFPPPNFFFTTFLAEYLPLFFHLSQLFITVRQQAGLQVQVKTFYFRSGRQIQNTRQGHKPDKQAEVRRSTNRLEQTALKRVTQETTEIKTGKEIAAMRLCVSEERAPLKHGVNGVHRCVRFLVNRVSTFFEKLTRRRQKQLIPTITFPSFSTFFLPSRLHTRLLQNKQPNRRNSSTISR